MKHSSDPSNHPIGPYSIYKVLNGFAALLGTIKSGISPSQFDPKAWYDRTIRVVGGLIMLLFLLAGLVLILRDYFRH